MGEIDETSGVTGWTSTTATTDVWSSTTGTSTNWGVDDWKRHYKNAEPKKPPEPEILIEKKNPTIDDILEFHISGEADVIVEEREERYEGPMDLPF